MKALNSTTHRASLTAGIGVLTVAAFILLFATPLLSTAATSPITLSVGGPYKSGQTVSISGTVTPATATNYIAISITNPNGVQVGVSEVAVSQTTGAFSYDQTAGGTNWIAGTYTVTATYSGASQSATFQYGTVTTTTTSATGVTTTIIINSSTTISSITTVSASTTVSQVTTVSQGGTTITQGGTTVTLAGTTVNNTTSVPSGPNGTDEALAGVAIVIAIIAIALTFMRRK